MDASSSFQVLVAVGVLTGLLLGLIRLLGSWAAAGLPDLPHPAPPPSATPVAVATDRGRLVALLSAAAAEALETEAVRIHSIAEAPSDPPHLGWPRIGKFQRHKPAQGLQF